MSTDKSEKAACDEERTVEKHKIPATIYRGTGDQWFTVLVPPPKKDPTAFLKEVQGKLVKLGRHPVIDRMRTEWTLVNCDGSPPP